MEESIFLSLATEAGIPTHLKRICKNMTALGENSALQRNGLSYYMYSTRSISGIKKRRDKLCQYATLNYLLTCTTLKSHRFDGFPPVLSVCPPTPTPAPPPRARYSVGVTRRRIYFKKQSFAGPPPTEPLLRGRISLSRADAQLSRIAGVRSAILRLPRSSIDETACFRRRLVACLTTIGSLLPGLPHTGLRLAPIVLVREMANQYAYCSSDSQRVSDKARVE